ncbi:hypothetical protein [Synechococcus sp. PCC 6312]|uniref:hypothetical protein n=1 Tax=Synechococcus sp. (strain ATCC 27167 / PCC 6312) TaxID=195253 RepID=UPI00029F16F9|nr:hypothetical protein [Synechococcus sp. PCC 6312]AFY60368.1 hypothetical protein Syn6312_1183 [Synechococcus sp. PCC 6312]
MLNTASRKFKVILYKGDSGSPWDVSNLVSPEGIEITRDQIQLEEPPIVNGTLTLRGTGGESLNPRVNFGRFAPGNLVWIQVQDSTGTWRDLPFGARLRINEFDFDDGLGRPGEGRKPPQITLMLTDKLGFAREIDPPTDASDIEIGESTPLADVVQRYLEFKDLTLSTVEGDPVPSAALIAPLTFDGKGNVIAHAHKLLWCNPNQDREAYAVSVDKLERVRLSRINLAPETALFEVLPEALVLYRDIREEKEKLPGKVKVTGVGKILKPTEDPPPQTVLLFDADGALVGSTTTFYSSDDSDLQTFRKLTTKTTRTQAKRVFPDLDVGNQLIVSERADSVIAYRKSDKAKVEERETTWIPAGLIDPEAFNIYQPRRARLSVKTVNYELDKTIKGSNTGRKAARGLNNRPEDVDNEEGTPYDLLFDGSEAESYVKINAEQYAKSVVSTDPDGQKQSQSFANAEALPPAADLMPDPNTIEESELMAEEEIVYPDQEPGINKRTKTIDLGDYVLNQESCRRMGLLYARFTLGNWLAKEIVFPISDTLLNSDWTPGKAIFVARGDGTSDVYLCSGEAITLDLRSFYAGVTGIWLGTRETGALDVPPNDPIGTVKRYLALESGGRILQENNGGILL